MIKVFGHYSPDTDATCSAIAWAWYLNEYTDHDATAYVLGDLNNETKFVLNQFNYDAPPILDTLASGDSVAIVDTNNPQELPENLSDTTIVSIIDHHKLVGGLSTDAPLTITMRPVAATGTIIYDLITAAGADIPDPIKGLLLSAIISDTLAFRSPTTTDHDQVVAKSLSDNLNLNIDEHAERMFAAKSDISNISDDELIALDSKKCAVGDKNLRISVVETTDPAVVLDRQAGVVAAIEKCIATNSDTDEVLFFVIDILNQNATALTYNELTKQIVSASFAVTDAGDTVTLPGVVSRKKQILPALKLA